MAVTALFATTPALSYASPTAVDDKASEPAVVAHLKGVPDVVAHVNGVAIAKAAFVSKYKKMTKVFSDRGRVIPESVAKRYQTSILRELVDKELLRQEMNRFGVVPNPRAVQESYLRHKELSKAEEKFHRFMGTAQASEEEIRSNIAFEVGVKQLCARNNALAVSDVEVRQHYEAHQDLFFVEPQVRVRHILIKVADNVSFEQGKERRQWAEKVHRLAVASGADFAILAKELSEEPSSIRGGDLGFISRGGMAPAFERIAFKLKVGEISRPIKTRFGWHVIKLEEKREGRQQSLEEVSSLIAKRIANHKARDVKAQLLKDLREKATIDTFLEKRQATIVAPESVASKGPLTAISLPCNTDCQGYVNAMEMWTSRKGYKPLKLLAALIQDKGPTIEAVYGALQRSFNEEKDPTIVKQAPTPSLNVAVSKEEAISLWGAYWRDATHLYQVAVLKLMGKKVQFFVFGGYESESKENQACIRLTEFNAFPLGEDPSGMTERVVEQMKSDPTTFLEESCDEITRAGPIFRQLDPDESESVISYTVGSELVPKSWHTKGP